MKFNYKKFIVITILTFFIGNLFSLFINEGMNSFKMPAIAPPNYVFPIVWSILFLLMSVSLYIITTKTKDKKYYIIYGLQLIVNSLWTLIFFKFKLLLLAFLWIILLIILVLYMIIIFYKVNKISAIILIPYFIWLLFAGYLNLMIYLLN